MHLNSQFALVLQISSFLVCNFDYQKILFDLGLDFFSPCKEDYVYNKTAW